MDIKPTGSGQRPPIPADARQRQRRKNWALLVVLVSLAVLFYLITIVRMGHHG